MVVVVAVVVAVVAVMQMMCEVGGGARERLACCSFQPSIYAKIHRVFNGGVALIGHFIPFPIRLGKFRIPHSAFRIPCLRNGSVGRTSVAALTCSVAAPQAASSCK